MMRRWIYACMTVLAFGGAFLTEYIVIRQASPQQETTFGFALEVMALVLFGSVAGVVCLLQAIHSNPYNITEGTVVAHAPRKPTPNYQGMWGLQIQDAQGRRGWLYFEENILRCYPIGSRYPIYPDPTR